ncbi:MAG TPA: hypothetical protein VE709_07480 [Pseudonocardiaceae bacterium]|nr:hypothetical protein [Pseudonocardiaceae bacterium]
MSYTLGIDPLAEEQIAALPPPALTALAEALVVLEIVPWNGLPLNKYNPDRPVRQLPFGEFGIITYLILDNQRRVDFLIVTWAG